MLEIIIAILLSLGVITSADQATQEVIDQNQAEIDLYIGDTDVDVI